MNTVTANSSSRCRSHGWLDTVAIGISVTCAVHCLLTPVLIIALPVLATTAWVQQDFHLWMMLLVLPTSGTAVLLGCRRHKDKAVLLLSILGLGLLAFVAVGEAVSYSSQSMTDSAHCAHCSTTDCDGTESGPPITGSMILNLFGAVLLSSAHVRNFLLCRRASCTHRDQKTSAKDPQSHSE